MTQCPTVEMMTQCPTMEMMIQCPTVTGPAAVENQHPPEGGVLSQRQEEGSEDRFA
jgi:hypothetical protein